MKQHINKHFCLTYVDSTKVPATSYGQQVSCIYFPIISLPFNLTLNLSLIHFAHTFGRNAFYAPDANGLHCISTAYEFVRTVVEETNFGHLHLTTYNVKAWMELT